MKDCDLQPLLGAYHDRELDAMDVAKIEDHLRACSRCTAELAALREISRRIASASLSASLDELDPAESTRLHQAVHAIEGESDNQPLYRIAGLFAALAASVLIVSGVWLLEIHPASQIAVQTPVVSELNGRAVTAPEWERVAMSLRADPRPLVTGNSLFFALRYSSTVDWMLNGLLPGRPPKELKPWEKPS